MSGVQFTAIRGAFFPFQAAEIGTLSGRDPDWDDRVLDDDDLWEPDELDDEPYPDDGDFWIETDDED